MLRQMYPDVETLVKKEADDLFTLLKVAGYPINPWPSSQRHLLA